MNPLLHLDRETPLRVHLVNRRFWTPLGTVFTRCTLPLYGPAGEFHKRHGHHAPWAARMLVIQRWLNQRRCPQRLVFDWPTQVPRRTTLAEDFVEIGSAVLTPVLFTPIRNLEWWFLYRHHVASGDMRPFPCVRR